MSTAIAVAGDLALLPSGEVVSLSRSDAVHALGKMVRLGGDQNGGCGILKDGHGVQCWAVDPEKRLEAESIEGTGPVIDVTGSLLGGCAVRQAGTVVCWDRGQPDPPHNSVHDDEPLRTPDLLAPSPPTATSPLAEPLRVFPLAKVTEAVAVAGGREGCALHRTGAVSCVGDADGSGAPTDPSRSTIANLRLFAGREAPARSPSALIPAASLTQPVQFFAGG